MVGAGWHLPPYRHKTKRSFPLTGISYAAFVVVSNLVNGSFVKQEPGKTRDGGTYALFINFSKINISGFANWSFRGGQRLGNQAFSVNSTMSNISAFSNCKFSDGHWHGKWCISETRVKWNRGWGVLKVSSLISPSRIFLVLQNYRGFVVIIMW